VTDLNGNVACGTLLSFSTIASDVEACVPTFTAVNSNAAAYFDSNGGQGVEISLTEPFIHVPTRTGLQISPSEVCAQGNGTENYGYPVQQVSCHTDNRNGLKTNISAHQPFSKQSILCRAVPRN
jgi:hypothetical protein